MPTDYGAAEPIIDLARKASSKVEKFFSYVPPYENKKKDTSYEDDMVRKANESFLKASQKKKMVKTTQSTTSTKKKPTAKKVNPKKRVAGK
jgi:hypothetical protein